MIETTFTKKKTLQITFTNLLYQCYLVFNLVFATVFLFEITWYFNYTFWC